jgi:hypothetical protein
MAVKFDYLTDDSEKSLSPFFSPTLLSTVMNGLLFTGACCVLFWPYKGMPAFFASGRAPLLFFNLSVATLFTHTYIGLRCGRGEFFLSNYPPGYEKEVVTFEKERNFFQYGLAEFLLHSILLILPFLPILIVSASVSGASLNLLVKVVFIILSASLLCRMAGFLAYLLWGRFSTAGYWGSRIFTALFLLATSVHAPAANPVRVLFELSRDPSGISAPFFDPYFFYLTTVLGAIILFTIEIHFLVKRYMNGETTP